MSVKLRPVVAEDSPRLLAWRNSPAVAAYMYSDHQISPEEHDRWFASAMAASDRAYWIIEQDGAPAGLANLTGINPAQRRCDWAFYLGETETRGRGLGAAVEYIVLEHVFGALGLHKLWCEVLVENKGVIRLHESFGFTREALFRDHVFKAGRFQDVAGLGLLADDWAAARQGCANRLARVGVSVGNLVMETA